MPICLTEAEVEALTGAVPDFDPLVERLEAGFRDYAAGRIAAPREERQRLVFPPGTERRRYPKDMRIVPALVPAAGASGVHVGCDALGHPKRSIMLLFDFETMQPLAVMEDRHLHYIRAGAPTAIAVRRFARPGASVLAVIGSGHIARVEAAAAVSHARIREVRVYSPTEGHREAFSRFCRDALGVAAAAVGSPRDAVEGADIATVATDSNSGATSTAAPTGWWSSARTTWTNARRRPCAVSWIRNARCWPPRRRRWPAAPSPARPTPRRRWMPGAATTPVPGTGWAARSASTGHRRSARIGAAPARTRSQSGAPRIACSRRWAIPMKHG